MQSVQTYHLCDIPAQFLLIKQRGQSIFFLMLNYLEVSISFLCNQAKFQMLTHVSANQAANSS